MNVEFNIIVDGLLNNIDTIEKANFHYNLFREYKEQAKFYENDFKDLKKQKFFFEMCDVLNINTTHYQSTYLRKLMAVNRPKYMDEPNPIIFMFYKNVANQYLKGLSNEMKDIVY